MRCGWWKKIFCSKFSK